MKGCVNMTKRKANNIVTDVNKLRIHLPNEMHLQACIRGGNIFRDKKKYTRKEKHKVRYE